MEIKGTSQGGQVNLNNRIPNEGIKQTEAIKPIEDKDVKSDAGREGYNKEDLDKAVAKLNNFLNYENTSAVYSVHEKLGDIMIKIVDNTTKEVLMEYPPQKILDMVAKMCELVGIGIDKKA